jgi:catechol 2,3-dioxygenase-like lactoylglutathione lyase family enzyme
VRIYDWNGTAWIQEGSDIDGEGFLDQNGYSVSLSSDGSRVAIGATGNDASFPNAGRVAVYYHDGSDWTKLGNNINGAAASDASGTSVSLSSDGSRVAIGAPEFDPVKDGTTFARAGHVRVYDWDGTKWEQAGPDIDGEAAFDLSGGSVSLSSDGSRVAIGAVSNGGGGGNSGHVRIYDYDGAAWNQAGEDIDGEAAADQSGRSVSLSSDGNRVAIGANRNDGTAFNAGHVRVYDWDGTKWEQAGPDIDGEAADDESGYSVSLSSNGNRVAIGAGGNDGTASSAGHVRIYDWNGTAWIQEGEDIDGEKASDASGRSVSLSSDGVRVAIAAIDNDDNGTTAGHTRVFSLPALPAAAVAPAPAPAPAVAPAPAALYQGPIPFLASPSTASAGGEITVTGIRLNSISSVQIDDVAAAIVSVEETSLVFTLPNGLEAGTKSIVFYGSQGKITFFSRLEYKAPPPPAVQPETDLEKVNAGSFDGYVAVYAKGHEGKTLSWKIAGKWFKTEITSSYQVFQRKTAAIGVDVKVDLYITGESRLSKLVRTR